MMVDIDEGVGGFASVNAQQNYRPNAVVNYAIQLMRAQRKGISLPAMPEADVPARVTNASDYAGTYTGGNRSPRSRPTAKAFLSCMRARACRSNE